MTNGKATLTVTCRRCGKECEGLLEYENHAREHERGEPPELVIVNESMGTYVGRHVADPPRPSLAERYAAWRESEDGEAVWRSVKSRAFAIRSAGWTRYGIATLWELARYDRSLQVGPSGGFKLNNDYRSRMARELMETYPVSIGDLFETRELKA